jgi:hypothetical protein
MECNQGFRNEGLDDNFYIYYYSHYSSGFLVSRVEYNFIVLNLTFNIYNLYKV